MSKMKWTRNLPAATIWNMHGDFCNPIAFRPQQDIVP